MMIRKGLGAVLSWSLALYVVLVASPPSRAADFGLGEADVRAFINDKLSDPEKINAFLQPRIERATKKGGALSFLDTFAFEFKWFNADETGEDPGLGFEYSFGRQLENWQYEKLTKCKKVCTRLGGDINFAMSGNLAFDKEKNPNNFLDTKLSVALVGSHGGAIAQTDEWKAEWQRRSDIFTDAPTLAEREAAQQAINEHVASAFANHYYGNLAAEISYEANQDFSERQLVCGGRVGFAPKAWSDLSAQTWEEIGWLSRINLPDYLFAALRWLTKSGDCAEGFRRCFVPTGMSFPIMTAGVAYVDPHENSARLAAEGKLEGFPRFDAEITFETLAFQMGGSDILFGASYRYYREIVASSSIKNAGLDEFDYLVLTLGPALGPFVRYTKGKLPFDLADQQVFEVGIKANFEAIKDFIF